MNTWPTWLNLALSVAMVFVAVPIGLALRRGLNAWETARRHRPAEGRPRR